jgi:hypothetical protein
LDQSISARKAINITFFYEQTVKRVALLSRRKIWQHRTNLPLVMKALKNTDDLGNRRILYICRGGSVLDWEKARALLKANAPDAVWDHASKNQADNTYRVNGTQDGLESYYASLADDGKMLAFWTQEDDEAARTETKVDTPSVSSVVGSNEKRTGEVTAGHPPIIDSESGPEINLPDVPANAGPSSTPQVVFGARKPDKDRQRCYVNFVKPSGLQRSLPTP